jgi:Outer membrane protein beta-barrel domain
MKRLWILSFMALTSCVAASAQGPQLAGQSAEARVSLGYEYLNFQVPSGSSVPMHGTTGDFSVDYGRRLGAKLEAGYGFATGLYGGGYSARMLSYLGGPILYAYKSERFALMGEALLGGAKIDGKLPGPTQDYKVMANRFAWAAGAGAEIRISPATRLHLGADYLRTTYFNTNLALAKQGNLRTTASIVYVFGRHRY